MLIFCALAGALSATPASAIVGDLKPFTADSTWHCGPRTQIAIVGNNRDLQIADVVVWRMKEPFCFPSRLQARVNIRVRNVEIPELISTMPVCGD